MVPGTFPGMIDTLVHMYVLLQYSTWCSKIKTPCTWKTTTRTNHTRK